MCHRFHTLLFTISQPEFIALEYSEFANFELLWLNGIPSAPLVIEASGDYCVSHWLYRTDGTINCTQSTINLQSHLFPHIARYAGDICLSYEMNFSSAIGMEYELKTAPEQGSVWLQSDWSNRRWPERWQRCGVSGVENAWTLAAYLFRHYCVVSLNFLQSLRMPVIAQYQKLCVFLEMSNSKYIKVNPVLLLQGIPVMHFTVAQITIWNDGENFMLNIDLAQDWSFLSNNIMEHVCFASLAMAKVITLKGDVDVYCWWS